MTTSLATGRTVGSEWTGTGEWMAAPGFGVYIHIPFCLQRCNYCDFNTYEGLEGLYRRYVDALVRAIESWDGPAPVATSVFFGGGTPTLLAPSDLGRLLAAARDRFGIVDDAEVTVEANPETVDEATFEQLLDRGFNRVSIGVQSLAEPVLRRLGRTHSGEVALHALRAARRAGVGSVNADLIYGSPWESDDDWRATLAGVLEVEPDHVSAYALTIEEGTPLATLVASGRAPQVDPDVQMARQEVADVILSGAGFARYEVSNWARPGAASRHNVLYWSAGDYAGFGAGAHGHVRGRRWWSLRLPRDFVAAVDAGDPTEAGHESLDDRARTAEALVLGLRLTSGIPVDAFTARFGMDYLDAIRPVLDDLRACGLVEIDGDVLKATARGTAVANEVACRLL